MKTCHIGWAALAAILLASAAQGATFTGHDGFSLEYPDGWIHNASLNYDFDKPGIEKPIVQGMVRSPQTGPTGFNTNATIVVVREANGIDEATLPAYRQQVASEVEKAGISLSDIQSKVISLNGRKAFSVTWNARMAESPVIRQTQRVVTGEGKAYIVTCSAAASEYTRHEATFEKIFQSMRVPGADNPVRGGWFTDAVTIGIAGGLAAAVVVAALWMRKRKAAQNTAFGASPLNTPYVSPYAPAATLPPPPTARVHTPAAPAADVSALEALAAATAPADVPADSDDGFIRFLCPCGRKIKAPLTLSGRLARCPACQAVLTVP